MSVELDSLDASIRADYHYGSKLAGFANDSPPLQLRNVDLVRGDVRAGLRGPEAILEHVRGIVTRLD